MTTGRTLQHNIEQDDQDDQSCQEAVVPEIKTKFVCPGGIRRLTAASEVGFAEESHLPKLFAHHSDGHQLPQKHEARLNNSLPPKFSKIET